MRTKEKSEEWRLVVVRLAKSSPGADPWHNDPFSDTRCDWVRMGTTLPTILGTLTPLVLNVCRDQILIIYPYAATAGAAKSP